MVIEQYLSCLSPEHRYYKLGVNNTFACRLKSGLPTPMVCATPAVHTTWFSMPAQAWHTGGNLDVYRQKHWCFAWPNSELYCNNVRCNSDRIDQPNIILQQVPEWKICTVLGWVICNSVAGLLQSDSSITSSVKCQWWLGEGKYPL